MICGVGMPVQVSQARPAEKRTYAGAAARLPPAGQVVRACGQKEGYLFVVKEVK